jgi:ureidoglycolate lyase
MTQSFLKPEPLTHEAFSPFGDLISTKHCNDIRLINEGHTVRFNNLANLALSATGLMPCLSIFRSEAWQLPHTVRALERHPLTSQAFIPLGRSPYLIVVAPAGPLLEHRIQAFIGQPGQGINYHPGTWHHYNVALETAGDFLVVDADGDTPNCDEITLKQPIEIRP